MQGIGNKRSEDRSCYAVGQCNSPCSNRLRELNCTRQALPETNPMHCDHADAPHPVQRKTVRTFRLRDKRDLGKVNFLLAIFTTNLKGPIYWQQIAHQMLLRIDLIVYRFHNYVKVRWASR